MRPCPLGLAAQPGEASHPGSGVTEDLSEVPFPTSLRAPSHSQFCGWREGGREEAERWGWAELGGVLGLPLPGRVAVDESLPLSQPLLSHRDHGRRSGVTLQMTSWG